MVCGRYIYILLTMVYKPTCNWGGITLLGYSYFLYILALQRGAVEGATNFELLNDLKGYLVDHPTNREWVISPVKNGMIRVNPLVTGDITYWL